MVQCIVDFTLLDGSNIYVSGVHAVTLFKTCCSEGWCAEHIACHVVPPVCRPCACKLHVGAWCAESTDTCGTFNFLFRRSCRCTPACAVWGAQWHYRVAQCMARARQQYGARPSALLKSQSVNLLHL